MADLAIALELTGRDTGASAAADKVAGSVRNVGDAADHATQRSGGLMSALGGVAKVAGGFIVAQGLMELPNFLGNAARAAAEEETGIKRLAQAVENSGVSWESQSSAIEDAIHQREMMGFADDKLRSSLAMLTAQTGSVDEAFKRQALAMDLSRGAGIDLETASKLLGKVTEDNVNVLSRYGISVKEGATETELFAAIQQKFGGQAEATAQSAAVQWEIFQNQMGNLVEDIGSALLPVMTELGGAAVGFVEDLRQSGDLQAIVEGLAGVFGTLGQVAMQAFGVIRGVLSSDLFRGIVDQVGQFASAVQVGFDTVASVISAVIAGDIEVALQTLEDALGIDVSGLTGAIATAQEWLQRLQDASSTVAQVIAGEWESSPGIDPFVNAVGVGVQTITGTVLPALQAGVQTALDALAGFWATHGEAITATATLAWTTIQTAIQTVIDVVVPFVVERFGVIVAWVQANWPLIESIITSVLAVVQLAITTTVDVIQALWTTFGDTILQVTGLAWTAVSTAITTALDVMLGLIRTALLVLNGDWAGAWTELGTVLQTAWTGFVTIVETVGQAINTAAAAVWKAIQDGAGPALEALAGIIGGKLEEARQAVVGAVGGFVQAGGALLDGIIQGFRDAGPRLQGAMGQIVGGALNDLKRSLGIQSPSDYTDETIGYPMGEGIIQGLIRAFGDGDARIAAGIRAVVENAIANKIDPIIAASLAKAESNFRPWAVGDAGASVGLFQLHERGQGAGMGAARLDPETNASSFLGRHGALFQQLSQQFQGRDLAKIFGGKAEVSDPQWWFRYADAFDEIMRALGPLEGLAASSSEAVQELSQSFVAVDPAAERLEQLQTRLNTVIGEGFPRATDSGAIALAQFGQESQAMVDALLGGNATLEQTQHALIAMASQTNLTREPLRALNEGWITQEQALAQVLARAAEVNPAYASTAAGLIMGATSAEDATLNFLNLVASTQGVTNAVIPADQALRTMGEYMPIVSELAMAGKLSGDQLSGTLIGLANSSGIVKSNLDLQSASTADLNAELMRIVDELAIVDPRFGELNTRIQTAGTITDETRGDVVNLLATIAQTPGAIDPAITAHGNLGTAGQNAARVNEESWQDILREIRDSVRDMTGVIKTATGEIIGLLGSINETKIKIQADTKGLEKIQDEAEEALDWVQRLERETGNKIRFGGGPSGRASGGWSPSGEVRWTGEVGPELEVSRGGYILTHAEATRIAEDWGRSRSSGSVLVGGDGGGATVVNVYVEGDVISEDRLLRRLRTELINTGRRNVDIFPGLAQRP